MMDDPLVKLYPPISKLNLESQEVKLYSLLCTFLLFSIIFAISYFISSFFYMFKKILRTKEKIFWSLAFVRATFGFTCLPIGLYYLSVNDALKKDVVNSTTVLSTMVVYYSVGFFIFECTALYATNIIFRFFDPFLFAHHTLSLYGLSIVTYYGKCHFFAAVGLVLEGTTPFTCLCWMLLKAEWAHTRVWKLNQFILVHLFHCRTIVETYFCFISYFQWQTIWSQMPSLLFYTIYIQLLLQLFLLTPYWTYKKTQQLMNPIDWNHPELVEQKSKNGGIVNHTHQD